MAAVSFCSLALLFLLTWGSFVDSVTSHFTSRGAAVSLNGIPYFVSSEGITTLLTFQSQVLANAPSTEFGLTPVTIITADAATFSLESLKATVQSFEANDDVWNVGFQAGESRSCKSAHHRTFVPQLQPAILVLRVSSSP